ncbi:MAG: hypothetical protein Q4G61_11015 [Tissierellia bacterium]|nr:hypothetical protein [Tissierellia bacterium]
MRSWIILLCTMIFLAGCNLSSEKIEKSDAMESSETQILTEDVISNTESTTQIAETEAEGEREQMTEKPAFESNFSEEEQKLLRSKMTRILEDFSAPVDLADKELVYTRIPKDDSYYVDISLALSEKARLIVRLDEAEQLLSYSNVPTRPVEDLEYVINEPKDTVKLQEGLIRKGYIPEEYRILREGMDQASPIAGGEDLINRWRMQFYREVDPFVYDEFDTITILLDRATGEIVSYTSSYESDQRDWEITAREPARILIELKEMAGLNFSGSAVIETYVMDPSIILGLEEKPENESEPLLVYKIIDQGKTSYVDCNTLELIDTFDFEYRW